MGAPENDPQFTIARLNKKINEDQVEMAKMMEDCQTMQARLERKKATEQLAAWAIDRAIETIRHREEGSEVKSNAESVIAIADQYCTWIAGFKQDEITPEKVETIQ